MPFALDADRTPRAGRKPACGVAWRLLLAGAFLLVLAVPLDRLAQDDPAALADAFAVTIADGSPKSPARLRTASSPRTAAHR